MKKYLFPLDFDISIDEKKWVFKVRTDNVGGYFLEPIPCVSVCYIKSKPFVSKFITNFVFKLRGMGWQYTN